MVEAQFFIPTWQTWIAMAASLCSAGYPQWSYSGDCDGAAACN
jgi:hypothetical protein